MAGIPHRPDRHEGNVEVALRALPAAVPLHVHAGGGVHPILLAVQKHHLGHLQMGDAVAQGMDGVGPGQEEAQKLIASMIAMRRLVTAQDPTMTPEMVQNRVAEEAGELGGMGMMMPPAFLWATLGALAFIASDFVLALETFRKDRAPDWSGPFVHRQGAPHSRSIRRASVSATASS